MHLESVDFLHNNLLVILLLSTAPRLRFMDLTGNRIGGLIMHERIEYRMLGNPVESAVLYFDRRRMLDWWNELIAPQSMQIEGPKNVPPIIIFAEDEFAQEPSQCWHQYHYPFFLCKNYLYRLVNDH